MRRPIPKGAVGLIFLAAVGAGCGPTDVPSEDVPGTLAEASVDADPSFPVSLVDDAGRRVELATPPRRIVSLVPASTRILVALNRGDRIVGRTDYDQEPELEEVPSVGGGLEPSMERVVSLEPDLVVRFRADSDPGTPRSLDAAGIAHLAVRPDRIEDVYRMIDLLGRATGAGAQAEALAEAVTRELEEVRERVAGVTRPRVAYLLGGNPPLAAGRETFLHELVELAGAENVLAGEVELYAPVSVEALFAREIDLLIVTEGSSLPAALRALPVIRVPRAVESPGLEVGESARTLARRLHPDRFP